MKNSNPIYELLLLLLKNIHFENLFSRLIYILPVNLRTTRTINSKSFMSVKKTILNCQKKSKNTHSFSLNFNGIVIVK